MAHKGILEMNDGLYLCKICETRTIEHREKYTYLCRECRLYYRQKGEIVFVSGNVEPILELY